MINATLFAGWYPVLQLWPYGTEADFAVDGGYASISSVYRFLGLRRGEDSIGRGEVRHSDASAPGRASSCFDNFEKCTGEKG